VNQCEAAYTRLGGPRVIDSGVNTIRLGPPVSRGVVAVPGATAVESDPLGRRRRQLSHDIRHELGTIMMLASLLVSGDDVGPDGRHRAGQLHREARWLLELQNAYEDSSTATEAAESPRLEPIRLDLCAREMAAVLRPPSDTDIQLMTSEVWALADKLAFWRAMRNVVGNAIRAAGPAGRVAVRVERSGYWAVAQVDDNGPGFGAACSGTASVGLDIVHESVAACSGQLKICRSTLGGCCVHLRLPGTSVPHQADEGTLSVPDGVRVFDQLADM
jgi:signal transduction histidine kinase